MRLLRLQFWRPALVLLSIAIAASTQASSAGPHGGSRIASSVQLQTGGAVLQIDFAKGSFDMPQSEILDRIQSAAHAVTVYYGLFPVRRARILVVPVPGAHGVLEGTTWGDRDGFPGFTRVSIGEHTSKAELKEDWIITHELVHMGFASQPDDLNWLEEGLATYVEPIARAQAGELTTERVWGDMVSGMPLGEPGARDRGMNRTHTWGRTYWGGALFCLVADIEIRKQTKNQKGLQDALRAIVLAGGTIDTSRSPEQLFRSGDQTTGTQVMEEMYRQWSVEPIHVDLDKLWHELGIGYASGQIKFDLAAPLSAVRSRMTDPHETVDPIRFDVPYGLPTLSGVRAANKAKKPCNLLRGQCSNSQQGSKRSPGCLNRCFL